MINGKIILCQGINLDIDMINVLDYTEEQMIALCTSKQVAFSNNYSFIDDYFKVKELKYFKLL